MNEKRSIMCRIVLTSDPVYFDDGTVSGDVADILEQLAKNIRGTPHFSQGHSQYLKSGTVNGCMDVLDGGSK